MCYNLQECSDFKTVTLPLYRYAWILGKDLFEKYKRFFLKNTKKNLPTTRDKDNQISLGDTMTEGFIPHKADAASYSIEDGSAFT